MPEADDQLVHHVPDEVSVRVSTTRHDPDRLYGEVRDALNAYVGQLPTGLRAEIRPRALVESREPEPLRELEPGTPWVALPEPGWQLRYQLGADRVGFAAPATEERQHREQRVRELINMLNFGAAGHLEVPAGQNWILTGGSPNWLTAALPFSCGSPAALPRAESKRQRLHFHFDDRLEQRLRKKPEAEPARVIVAVLDTCPESFDDHGNTYLQELIGALQVERPTNTVPEMLDDCLPWWQEDMPKRPRRDRFAMPDHGLFVAGIVHDIAPHVELHLIRVLNDYGVGQQAAIDQVLRELPDRLWARAPGARLIFNLSLGTAVPVPRRRYLRRWLPESPAAKQDKWPRGIANELLERAHGGLKQTVDWLHERGVLVVAAAGNDGLREHLQGVPPPPRYPAYYESVLAVAAAGPDGSPAQYSNRGDVKPFHNGVTTFGGDVVTRGRDRPPLTDVSPPEESIVGVYSSPTLPDGKPNETGWARWSGTSFSAPIVTGLAALLWQQDDSQNPADLIRRVRRYSSNISTTRAQGTDPDGPLDAPYLRAWQEPY